MYNMKGNTLGEEIKRHLGSRKQAWLAKESGVTSSTISRIIRGLHTPTNDTIEAIAIALDVDVTHFLRLAGVPIPKFQQKRDPGVEHLAKKLNSLPFDLRKSTVVAFEDQLNIILSLFKREKELLGELEKEKAKALNLDLDNGFMNITFSNDISQNDMEIINILSPPFQDAVKLLHKYRPKKYAELMAGLRNLSDEIDSEQEVSIADRVFA